MKIFFYFFFFLLFFSFSFLIMKCELCESGTTRSLPLQSRTIEVCNTCHDSITNLRFPLLYQQPHNRQYDFPPLKITITLPNPPLLIDVVKQDICPVCLRSNRTLFRYTNKCTHSACYTCIIQYLKQSYS